MNNILTFSTYKSYWLALDPSLKTNFVKYMYFFKVHFPQVMLLLKNL